MTHQLLAEVMSTALMIIFGVGVHCDDVLKKTKYAGTGHLFAITTWAFGITVCLFVFGGVSMNPAMALLKVLLGKLTIAQFFPIAIAEMIGAFLGALIAYFMYADHFKVSEGQIDGVAAWKGKPGLVDELDRDIKSLLDRLSPTNRQIFWDRYVEDYGIDELSEKYKISKQAIYNRLARSRDNLKLMENGGSSYE